MVKKQKKQKKNKKKNPPANARDPSLVFWVGKIPGWRAWQPTAVFLPGESHGQRGLEGYTGSQKVRHD